MGEEMTERPRWRAYLFGGNFYERDDGGVLHSGWSPSIVRHMIRYFRQRWWRAGYSPLDWALHRGKSMPDHDVSLTPENRNETPPPTGNCQRLNRDQTP